MRGIHQSAVAATARRLGRVAALAAWIPVGTAHAQHHMAMSENHHDDSVVSVGMSVVAAEFDNMSYVGSYQGLTPTLSWTRGALAASAALGVFHVEKNGLSAYGPGDAMLTGHATVIATEALDVGVALHVMLPTGSERDDLGMGHVMVMPSVSASWRAAPVTLLASAGYGRALAKISADHDHGPSPLIDPMTMQEVTWSAGADLAIGPRVRLGGRASGAIPISGGASRVIGGGRVAWGTPRVTTAFELQLGVTGDPFTVRGVVETALRF